MAPTVSEQMQQLDNRKLIRKVQRAIAVLGTPGVTTLPESLYAGGSLIDLKSEGWRPVGIVNSDGFSYSAEREKDEISGLGYSNFVRTDVLRMPRQCTFTPLQSFQRHMTELTQGVDLSAVTQDATTGEVVYDEPELPVDKEYPLLIIGEDGPADENWVMGLGFGTVKIASTAETVWGGEGAVSTQISVDIFTDEATGTPVRRYFGGTGALKHKDELGFAAA